MVVQGPINKTEVADSAFFNGEWITGWENLPVTSFAVYLNGNETYRDPGCGYGSLEMYNYMEGKVWDGSPFIDPHTGDTTTFAVAGNPVLGEGWFMGEGWPDGPDPNDMRYVMSTGPIDLQPDEVQEVVYALFMAQGTDRLNSITKLKEKAAQIQAFYYGDETVDIEDNDLILPQKFDLKQNYPNPFNPTTTIKYTISSVVDGKFAFTTNVRLSIYNILGQEIVTLVNEQQKPGRYKIQFDASHLSSGIYFYRLIAGGFTSAKKCVLMK